MNVSLLCIAFNSRDLDVCVNDTMRIQSEKVALVVCVTNAKSTNVRRLSRSKLPQFAGIPVGVVGVLVYFRVNTSRLIASD